MGDLQPEVLERNPVYAEHFAYIPFGGRGESGWGLWFFSSQALRDSFFRRQRRARIIKDIFSATRRAEDAAREPF